MGVIADGWYPPSACCPRWASELAAGNALAGFRLMQRQRALKGVGLPGSRWRIELMAAARQRKRQERKKQEEQDARR